MRDYASQHPEAKLIHRAIEPSTDLSLGPADVTLSLTSLLECQCGKIRCSKSADGAVGGDAKVGGGHGRWLGSSAATAASAVLSPPIFSALGLDRRLLFHWARP